MKSGMLYGNRAQNCPFMLSSQSCSYLKFLLLFGTGLGLGIQAHENDSRCIKYVRTSVIGSPGDNKKAGSKIAAGHVSSVNSVDQVKEVLDSLSRQSEPDSELYIHLLRVCASEKALLVGKQVHAHLIKSGLGSDVYVYNNLVTMYGKCGSPDDAYKVFDEMHQRTVVSWTSMVTAYTQNGRYKDAIQLYERMLLEGVVPNRVTFFTIIDACARGAMSKKSKLVAGHTVESGLHRDPLVGTALVNMYGKCGHMKDARAVFDEIVERSVITWTALITAYANRGCFTEAFELFQQMQLEEVTPNKVTYITVLNACADPEALAYGKLVHEQTIKIGLASDLLVGTALINMYSKCGCLLDARGVFNRLLERDVVSWNAIIAAYAELGSCNESFQMFRRMLVEGMTPTKVTFISLLNACSSPEALKEGKIIHEYVEFESDIVVGTALLNMYGKCGALEDAHRVFNQMSLRNVVSWNAMFALYADHGYCSRAFHLYQQMQLEGLRPDGITFMSLFNTCARPEDLKNGRHIHCHIAECGLEADVSVGNAVLDMYGKCGSLEDGHLMFKRMELRNVISWTAMITACFQHGNDKEALLLFHQMQLEAVGPDRVTFASVLNACANLASLKDGKAVHACVMETGLKIEVALGTALINMYGKCGYVEEAQAVFDVMSGRDTTSWNSMIGAYAHHGYGRESIYLFRKMQQEDVNPDTVTFVIVLSVCKHAGLLDEGLECFAAITEQYGMAPTAEHYGCLIDLLGRTGQLEEAETFINHLVQPDPMVWTSLLDACRVHGDVERAKRTAQHCIKLDPRDAPTYVTLSNIYVEAGMKKCLGSR